MDATLTALKEYTDKGWKLFPLKKHEKIPYTSHGFKDASSDYKQIEKWYRSFPGCNWGMATGDIVVIDIDVHKGGELNANYPKTLMVQTANKGFHLYYSNPNKEDVRNSVEAIAPGVDVRGYGGYVVVPPSTLGAGKEYTWDKVVPMVEVPLSLFKDTQTPVPEKEQISDDVTSDLKKAIVAMTRLSTERVDNYEKWVGVGQCLYCLGQAGLQLWDDWSKKSDKYISGKCAEKWETFDNKGLGVGSLLYWADEDSPRSVSPAPKNATPADYEKAMKELGYQFRLNVANNEIVVNGVPMDDISESLIYYELKTRDYLYERTAQLGWIHEASNNSFHPIADYLNNLEWDGKDHIGQLCSYFEDEQGVFPLWFKRWAIGAVARVLATPRGQQNRVLVLDGRQDLGKSYFVRWLARGVPGYHIEGAINPDDKDDHLRLMSKWIWEVSELDSTTTKAEINALKAFLSKEDVTVRKSYGHRDTVKPALASFIGTVNNVSGFLNDPTGSRRFMSCTLTKVNWNYATEVDVNQVWAQAVALYRSGEQWNLNDAEKAKANEINSTYEIESPIVQYVVRHFDIDQKHDDWVMPSSEISDALRGKGVLGYDQMTLSKHIASTLKQLGLESKRRTPNGYSNKITCWVGIRVKSKDTGNEYWTEKDNEL
jgi:hypothetical protein